MLQSRRVDMEKRRLQEAPEKGSDTQNSAGCSHNVISNLPPTSERSLSHLFFQAGVPVRLGFTSHCDSRTRNSEAGQAAITKRPCRSESAGEVSGQRIGYQPAGVGDGKLRGKGATTLVPSRMRSNQRRRGNRNQSLSCAIECPQKPEDAERRCEPTGNQAGCKNDAPRQNGRGGPAMAQAMANSIARRPAFHASRDLAEDNCCCRRTQTRAHHDQREIRLTRVQYVADVDDR